MKLVNFCVRGILGWMIFIQNAGSAAIDHRLELLAILETNNRKQGMSAIIFDKKTGGFLSVREGDYIYSPDNRITKISEIGVYFELEGTPSKVMLKKSYPKNTVHLSEYLKLVRPKPAPDIEVNEKLNQNAYKIKVKRKYFNSLLGLEFKDQLNRAKLEFDADSLGNEGYRITRIREDSVYHTIGLQDGDLIVAVNNQKFTSADSSIKALKDVRTLDKFQIRAIRKGRIWKWDVEVKPQ